MFRRLKDTFALQASEPNPVTTAFYVSLTICSRTKADDDGYVSALSSGMQLPLQTQLQALFPGRLG
jgi:hypothetical protein